MKKNCRKSKMRKAGKCAQNASLALLLLTVPTVLQADVLTENTTVTSVGSTAYSSENGSILTFQLPANYSSANHTGALSGNMGVVVDLTARPNNNSSRVTFTTANPFTGGLTVKGGTVNATAAGAFGDSSGTITLENATLMSAVANPVYSQQMTISGFGALRPSNNFTYAGQITGAGDLLIHCDGNASDNRFVMISSTANDYTGITNIGGYNVPGSTNNAAGLKLGANEVLPNSTLVQIGVHYGTANSSTSLNSAYLDMNGKTETVAGVTGAGKIRNSAVDADKNPIASTLKIVLNGTENTLTGGISGGPVNLNISGTGSQKFGGTLTNSSITVSGDAVVGLLDGAKVTGTTISLASADNFQLGTGVQLIASNGISGSSGTLQLNGADLTVGNVTGGMSVTNSNTDDLSTIKITGTGRKELSRITGNVRLVLSMSENQNNANRVMPNANSRFAGGVEIYKGTLRVDNLNIFSENPKMTCADGKERFQIDFSGGSLMTNQLSALNDSYVFNILDDRAAIRFTGGAGTLGALVTGNGSLEIVNDGEVVLSNTGNDYTGRTYIGFLSYRSDGLGGEGALRLGNNEVIPDTSVVHIGTEQVYGTLNFNINGKTETVAGLTGGTSWNANGAAVVNGNVTGSGTLILNDTEMLYWTGNIKDSVNIRKTGTGNWTMDGNMSSSGTLTVENGILVLSGTAKNLNVAGGLAALTGSAESLTLSGGALQVYAGKDYSGQAVSVSKDSQIIVVPNSIFLQEKFESPNTLTRDEFYKYSGDLTENANEISNMDQWVNKNDALKTQTSTDVWGALIDKSVTNVFETVLENTTDAPITIDIGKAFRNDASVLIVEKESGAAVAELAFESGNSEFSERVLEGVVLEPGKQYTVTVRAARFNQTIGTSGGTATNQNGLNADALNLVGIGVRLSGTDRWYGMNVDEVSAGDWGWAGSGLRSVMTKDSVFAPKSLTVAEGATLDMNVVGGTKTTLAAPVTGGGTLLFSNSYNAEAHAQMAAGTDGDVWVGENVRLSGTGNFTIDGEVRLENGATLFADGESGTITLQNITGTGTLEFDLDSLTSGNEQPYFVLMEAKPDNLLDSIDLLLTTEDRSAHAGKIYTLLESSLITSDVFAEWLGDESYYWQISSLGSGIQIQLNGGSVPEPSTWTLLLLGTFGFLALRRGTAKTA